MTITFEQLTAGIVKYVDTDLAARATGLTKFVMYFYLPSLPKAVQKIYNHLQEQGLFEDVLDNNGNIKLDDLYKRAKDAMEKCSKIEIPRINYWADASDIDNLYQILKTL